MSMPGAQEDSFPFTRLPREIRNKIYKELLCSFDRPQDNNAYNKLLCSFIDPQDSMKTTAFGSIPIGHSIDTSILQTSTQIHREAYDVMVKTNRFVFIQCSGGIPLINLLLARGIPVVTVERRKALQIHDCVLSIALFASGPSPRSVAGPTEHVSLVILFRDLDALCLSFMENGNNMMPQFDQVKLVINVAPQSFASPESSQRYRDSLDGFFTEITQRNLLHPFQDRLRGYRKVLIVGKVSKELATAVQDQVTEDRTLDWEATILSMVEGKDAGDECFRKGDLPEASLKWLDTAAEIDNLRESTSWASLIRAGGEPFVNRVAKIYFLLKINIAHIELIRAKEAGFFLYLASDALAYAHKSILTDFWMKGYRFRPENKHRVKLFYRSAMCFRMEDNIVNAQLAMRIINKAHELLPNDPLILKERDEVIAWVARS